MENKLEKDLLLKFLKNIKKLKTESKIDFLLIDSYVSGFIKGKEAVKNE